MTTCSKCGADTKLYVHDVPMCPACADALEGKNDGAQGKTPPQQSTSE